MVSWPDPKDPADVADYELGWPDEVLNGDTIVSVESVDITPVTIPPLEETDPVQREFTTNSTLTWLQGGKAGSSYIVSFTVKTAGDRTLQRSGKLKVKEL